MSFSKLRNRRSASGAAGCLALAPDSIGPALNQPAHRRKFQACPATSGPEQDQQGAADLSCSRVLCQACLLDSLTDCMVTMPRRPPAAHESTSDFRTRRNSFASRWCGVCRGRGVRCHRRAR